MRRFLAALLLCVPLLAQAAGFLSPIGTITQLLSDQGVVGSGYQILIYQAGTTTPATTYTTSALNVANSNPIVMGSNGRFQSVSVWAPSGTVLKMVIEDASNNVIAGGTLDNIPLINDVSGSPAFAYSAADSSRDQRQRHAHEHRLSTWGVAPLWG